MSRQKMLDLNQQVLDNTNRIKNIHRIAQETDETSTNVLRELGGQRQKIARNIDMNKQINDQLKKVNKTTNQMNRRALCIKASLCFAAILLFALLIYAVIYRINKAKS